jgi:hypothetical protein
MITALALLLVELISDIPLGREYERETGLSITYLCTSEAFRNAGGNKQMCIVTRGFQFFSIR